MATPTLIPVTTSATRRSMSCLEVLGTSRLGTSSKPYAEKLWWRPQHRKQRRITRVETPIGFNASECPMSMAGTGQLLLLVS
jgi:hypothetical protein